MVRQKLLRLYRYYLVVVIAQTLLFAAPFLYVSSIVLMVWIFPAPNLFDLVYPHLSCVPLVDLLLADLSYQLHPLCSFSFVLDLIIHSCSLCSYSSFLWLCYWLSFFFFVRSSPSFSSIPSIRLYTSLSFSLWFLHSPPQIESFAIPFCARRRNRFWGLECSEFQLFREQMGLSSARGKHFFPDRISGRNIERQIIGAQTAPCRNRPRSIRTSFAKLTSKVIDMATWLWYPIHTEKI